MANREKRFETIYTQGTSLSIVVDTETGVNYLVHDTGITPLLDKNGTIVITEVNFMLAAGYQHSNYEQRRDIWEKSLYCR